MFEPFTLRMMMNQTFMTMAETVTPEKAEQGELVSYLNSRVGFDNINE